jgi:hypothetical protein
MEFTGQIPDRFIELAREQYRDKVQAMNILAHIGATVIEQIDGHRRYCGFYRGNECTHDCATKEMGDGRG